MSVEAFKENLSLATSEIAGRSLDGTLQSWLNAEIGPQSGRYASLRNACHTGVEEGWLCRRSHAGIRFGRVFEPDEELSGFSVDVVEMDDIEGPHHAHPTGEIDLVMPIDDAARFDGHGAGRVVYGPGSAHHPTVAGGKALVLYLLPDGRIKFTRTD